MTQVDVSTSVGYSLKRATWALRVAMDARLREFDLSVSQYACLELLAQRPGLSNAELARGVFVTRQATHQLLSGLTSAGLVRIDGSGRDQRIALTGHGTSLLAAVSHAVAQIEQRMLAPLSPKQRVELRADLEACADALDRTVPAPTAGAQTTRNSTEEIVTERLMSIEASAVPSSSGTA